MTHVNEAWNDKIAPLNNRSELTTVSVKAGDCQIESRLLQNTLRQIPRLVLAGACWFTDDNI